MPELEVEDLKKRFVIAASIEFEGILEKLVDVGESRVDHLIIPVELFRLGLHLLFCPNLLILFNSFNICHVQLHPITWSFLVCFVHVCHKVKVSASPDLFSQILMVSKLKEKSGMASSFTSFYIKSSMKNTPLLKML